MWIFHRHAFSHREPAHPRNHFLVLHSKTPPHLSTPFIVTRRSDSFPSSDSAPVHIKHKASSRERERERERERGRTPCKILPTNCIAHSFISRCVYWCKTTSQDFSYVFHQVRSTSCPCGFYFWERTPEMECAHPGTAQSSRYCARCWAYVYIGYNPWVECTLFMDFMPLLSGTSHQKAICAKGEWEDDDEWEPWTEKELRGALCHRRIHSLEHFAKRIY